MTCLCAVKWISGLGQPPRSQLYCADMCTEFLEEPRARELEMKAILLLLSWFSHLLGPKNTFTHNPHNSTLISTLHICYVYLSHNIYRTRSKWIVVTTCIQHANCYSIEIKFKKSEQEKRREREK